MISLCASVRLCVYKNFMKFDIQNLKYDERGLIPAIMQDDETKEVLTLAYMNAESLRLTLQTGETWFWSRSRNELWHKGATSGNTQKVVEIKADCDADALVVLVKPNGAACHTGKVSCFYETVKSRESEVESLFGLPDLFRLIESRKAEMPENSYTTYLFEKGLDKILKKVGEEAAETIIAAKNADENEFIGEVADLVFHSLVLLVEKGVSLEKVSEKLGERHSKIQDSKIS